MPEVPLTPAETLRATHERVLAVRAKASEDAAALPQGPISEAARRLEAAARRVALLTRPAAPTPDPTAEQPRSLHADAADAR